MNRLEHALAALVVAGCGSGVRTPELTATFGVRIDQRCPSCDFDYNRTYVVAGFERGGASFELDAGDAVSATFRDQTIELTHGNANPYFYSATFELDSPAMADEVVGFALHRDGGDALDSSVAIVNDVDLTAVPVFASRSHDLTIAWTALPGDLVGWAVDPSFGDPSCVSGGSDNVMPDLGGVTIPANALVHDVSSGILTCTAVVEIDRVRTGILDPEFGGGTVSSTRQVDATFASMP
jgi:hypothetical protein